ncbi:MAG: hypothetical protein UV05_C0016G0008 [candidate division CPR1 bacterium GW2011_GWA2_42_17]|uniref:HNH nuclease domain-containing protein n=1 Tax=candidate division CPR1 bacterium GW2011_GWA2_42_17 TaxID=1618341 RepID=A0A0G0Z5F2_9BACT|nr:MAG: hypothetical protein UV05_C0016G0008 [candidate division CPR1 bacterium GW2011_GWA2_42_17]
MDYKFQRKRLNEISETKILDELEKAAKHFNYIEFGYREFSEVADVSGGLVKKRYGGWKKGLEALRKRLQEKGLDLSPRPHSPNRIYSDKELFEEMARVWQKVGQRPSKTEWEMSEPRISYLCYKKRFGGWTNACVKFIEYKMGTDILADDFVITNDEVSGNKKIEYKREISRDVPLGLRLKILSRDNFRCIFCGKSPATDFGTKLHIDHVVPFSKGGKSILENLQTLCEECNLGKSNRNI